MPAPDPEVPAPVATLDSEMSGIDALELHLPSARALPWRVWSAVWPKAAAIAVGLLLWQLVVWSGWKPKFLFPGPATTFRHLWDDRSVVLSGVGTTLRRAVEFYLIALVIGTLIAVVLTRSRTVRDALTPLLSGLQTMPNVAWVPFAILVFGLKQQAILFVTLLGTAPAIAITTLSAIDAIPPVLLRAGRVLGAGGVSAYRHVILPAALPGYVSGMKQGWAFAWRSLMAGELITNVAGTHSLGQLLSSYQEQSSPADVLAIMVVILAVGLLVDSLVFARLERHVLHRRGLTG
jgi:NitT/TauT family transport system permease protein